MFYRRIPSFTGFAGRAVRRRVLLIGVLLPALLAALLPLGCTSPPPCERVFLLDELPADEVTLREVDHDTRPAIAINGPRDFTVGGECGRRLRFAVSPTDGSHAPLHVSVRTPGSAWHAVPLRQTRPDSPGWKPYDLEELLDPGSEVRFSPSQPTHQGIWLADPTLEPSGEAKRPLVIVVLIDTLRFDRAPLGGAVVPTSPRLAALAEEGISFQRAYSTSSWTRPAVASLFTSLAPDEHRVRARSDRLSDSLTTWAEIARQNGLQTVAIATNPNVLPIWGFAQGFGRFIDLGARDWQEESNAFDVLAAAEDILAEESRPLFLYVHLMDPHSPYDPPLDTMRSLYADYVASSPGREPDASDFANVRHAVRRYNGEVRNADEALGDFVDDLRDRDEFTESLLLVVSDHGEEFLDHGGLYHGQNLFEEQVHIPMLLKAPHNRFAGTQVDGIVSIVDAMPTIAAMLGWTTPPGIRGRSMLPAISGEGPTRDFAFASLETSQHDLWAAIGDRAKLIASRARADEDTSMLFDIASDPSEQHALKDERLEAALRDRLDARVSEGRAGWHLKLCGGTQDATVSIHVDGISGRVESIDLEEDDAVTQKGGRLNFRAGVGTRRVLTELLGARVRTNVRDEDTIWFEGDRPTVRASTDRGAKFRVLAGSASEHVERRQIELDPDAWTVNALEAPRCSADAGFTELLIWRIEPHAEAETAAADDRLRERLRALGYVE